jgi:predicted exporter
MQAALRTEGFVPSTFHDFFADLVAPPPGPLTFRELLESPLADMARPFRVAIGDRVGLVTPVTGVRDGVALRARFAGLRDVYYLDQRAFLEEAYGRFRKRTLELVGVGLVVVFLIVYGRYRSLRLSLAAFLPCVLAAGATMSILALSGRALNLMHLIGILLVLSMGADYGIFVVESRNHAEKVGATLLSVIVAMTTTVFSFGLLGMSANPALSALGVTSGLGVLLSALFAPAALILLRSERVHL